MNAAEVMVEFVDRLRELLRYEPETGMLYWRERKYPFRSSRLAGRITNKGYRVVNVRGKMYFAHRLAWLIECGRWPAIELDHINGNRDDNRMENLRECTRSQNMAAQIGARSDSKSGIRGVVFHRATGKWLAAIGVNGKRRHLGVFAEREDARTAYRAAAVKYFGEFADLSGDNNQKENANGC